jgi:hypothetical protein
MPTKVSGHSHEYRNVIYAPACERSQSANPAKAIITPKHPVLGRDGTWSVAVEHPGPIVGQRERGCVSEHDDPTCTYHVSSWGEDGVVDAVLGGAEQIPSLGEGVRREIPDGLVLEQQEREVLAAT